MVPGVKNCQQKLWLWKADKLLLGWVSFPGSSSRKTWVLIFFGLILFCLYYHFVNDLFYSGPYHITEVTHYSLQRIYCRRKTSNLFITKQTSINCTWSQAEKRCHVFVTHCKFFPLVFFFLSCTILHFLFLFFFCPPNCSKECSFKTISCSMELCAQTNRISL